MKVSPTTFVILFLSWIGAIVFLILGHLDWAIGCLIVNIAFSRTATRSGRN